MSARIIQFLREHRDEIILLIGVVLISLLSFTLGYIVAKEQEKEPIRILPYELRIQPNYEYKISQINSKLFVIRGNS